MNSTDIDNYTNAAIDAGFIDSSDDIKYVIEYPVYFDILLFIESDETHVVTSFFKESGEYSPSPLAEGPYDDCVEYIEERNTEYFDALTRVVGLARAQTIDKLIELGDMLEGK